MCDSNSAFALPIFAISANVVHPAQIKLQTSTVINLCSHICSEKKSHLNRAFSRGYETLLRCFLFSD